MSGYIGLINIDAAAGTSGTSDSTKALQSATTTVNVAAASAPTTGQVLTATSGTAATWQSPSTSTQGTNLNLSATTQSTNKDTGALVVEGGAGIEKDVFVGGKVATTGIITIADTTQSSSKDTGCLIVEGGVGIEKHLYVGGDLNVTGTNAATTTNALESATTTVNVSSAAAPSNGQVLTATSSTTATWQAAAGGAEFTATDKTASYTAVSGDWVIYDLSAAGAAVTLTLPATPSQGDAVRVSLKTENATPETIYVAIARNGSTINGGSAAEYETFNILWKSGDTVTFRATAASAWVTSDRCIENRFQAMACLSGDQLNLTDGAWNVINFAQEIYDYNGDYDAATNYDYTAPVSGTYSCTGWIRFTTASTEKRMLGGFFKNGVEERVTETISNNIDPCNVGLTTDIVLAAGDVLTYRGLPTTGASTADVTDLNSQTFVQYRLVASKGSGSAGGGLAGTSLSLTDTTQSTSTDSGTLTVSGGVGIAKNLHVGGDLTLTGAAWTDYSGTTTVVGFSSPTTKVYYKQIGKTVFVHFNIIGTSNSTTTSFTVPVASAATTATDFSIRAQDNGTWINNMCFGDLPASSSTVTLFTDAAASTWTGSGTKQVQGTFTYQSV